MKYPPVGHCIYCGGDAPVVGTLSDEHIMPYGLGGNDILPDASCRACAAITSQVEGRLLRGAWWPTRVRLGIQSRSAKRGAARPTFPATQQRDGARSTVDLDGRDHPGYAIAQFRPAAILRGEHDEGVPAAQQLLFAPTDAWERRLARDRILGRSGNVQLTVRVNLNVTDLVRFLAKVAWSFAVATWGYDAFAERFLPDLIRGDGAGGTTYVGGLHSPIELRRLDGLGLHAIAPRMHGNLATVCIQLLRETSTSAPPIYEVVVGRLRGI